jgi:hypothetical protein
MTAVHGPCYCIKSEYISIEVYFISLLYQDVGIRYYRVGIDNLTQSPIHNLNINILDLRLQF